MCPFAGVLEAEKVHQKKWFYRCAVTVYCDGQELIWCDTSTGRVLGHGADRVASFGILRPSLFRDVTLLEAELAE